MSVITQEAFYLEGYKKSDIVVLSRLISLIESQKSSHQKIVDSLLKKLHLNSCYILGVTGTPGAGKSTLINLLGVEFMTLHPHAKLAVIAIDPSSEITGGSILGDKTRMSELAEKNNVFIRPISSKGSYGGITPRMEKILAVLSAWKFDFIIIETVGIGQSEADIRLLVNDLALIVPPATGDDLQAMKRGILELVDVVCINKIDLVSATQAENSLHQFQSSLHVLQQKDIPVFLTTTNATKKIENFLDWVFNKYKKNAHKNLIQSIAENISEKTLVSDLQSLFREWYRINITPGCLADKNKILQDFAKYLLSKK